MGNKPTKATAPTSHVPTTPVPTNTSMDVIRQKQREALLSGNKKYIANVLPYLDLMMAHSLDDTSPTHQLTGRNFLFISIPLIINSYDKTFLPSSFNSQRTVPTFSDGRPILNSIEMKSHSSTIELLRIFYNETLTKHEKKYGIYSLNMIQNIKNQKIKEKEQTLKTTLPLKLGNASKVKDIEKIAVELRRKKNSF